MKTRQAMFSVCICFILCGPLLLFCLEKAGVHLPDDMTAKSAQYLSGGMSYVNVRSFLNFPSITSGEFQNATEKEIGNYIPAKADALLGNAAIQRCGIEASNTLFNWSCYPTYYGSNHIYIPAEGALASLPAAKNNWGGATDFFKSLNAYAQENENLKFIVYIVAGREYLPDANPAFSLTASPVTLDNLLKEVQRNIISPNLIIETNYYQYNLETFYENYYKSDLHWNIQGALAANEQIAKHLNSPYLEDYSIAELSSILFAGTESRQSLYMISDKVLETQNSFENLLVEKEDGQILYGNEHLKYDAATQTQKYFDFYGQYYCDLENARITGGYGASKVLLVADSYGAALERPLANACATLYHSDVLRRERQGNISLSSQLQRDAIGTVVFVGRIADYESFNSRNPHFWN